MNKTYAKKPTKARRKEARISKIVFITVLGATMLGNLVYDLSSNRVKVNEKEPQAMSYQIEDKNATTSVVVAIKASPEVISTPIITDKPSVELQIRAIAKEMNFKWTDYLVKLAYCESRLDPKATNNKGNNPKTSYDRGLFQYNSHWQKVVSDDCAYDVRCSTLKTIELINNGKQHLWACNSIVLAKK
jgi:hypothetical protein